MKGLAAKQDMYSLTIKKTITISAESLSRLATCQIALVLRIPLSNLRVYLSQQFQKGQTQKEVP